jgi:hypothetical protein
MMINLKDKVGETAAQMKNAAIDTPEKVGPAFEAARKGDRPLTDMARKAVGLGVEAIDSLKEVATQVVAIPQGGSPTAGAKTTNPGRKIKVAREKAKKSLN